MKKTPLMFSLLVICGLLVSTSIVFGAPISNTYNTVSFLDLDLNTDMVKDRINWKPANGTVVSVTDTAITGDIWGETVGWIRLNPTNGGVTNNCSGVLSGYAFGQNTGWINFKPTNGGVTINTTTGDFSGYAWSQNHGWIHFDPAVSAKHVQTDWHGCPQPPPQRWNPPINKPDKCSNISGVQETVPAGYELRFGICEQVTTIACNDGIDNDSDGKTDYPTDPGCVSSYDSSEKDPINPILIEKPEEKEKEIPTESASTSSFSVTTLDNRPVAGSNNTKNPLPTIAGNGISGDSVVIKDINGNVICSTTVTSDGTWSCSINKSLTKGQNYLSIFANGPKGSTVIPLVVLLGDFMVTTVDDKPVNDKNSIEKTNPTLKGEGNSGDVITINDDNGITICTTVVSTTGMWECTPTIPLKSGENNLVAIAKGPQGESRIFLKLVLGAQKSLPLLAGLVNPFESIDDVREFVEPLREPILVATAAGIASTIPGFIARIVHFVLTALIYRRRNPWGVVYDSKTKQPLDPAIVTVTNIATGQVVEQKTTDMEGRYGYFLQPGTYNISANKTNYVFPSVLLAGKQFDNAYDDLYFGTEFTVPPGVDKNRVVTMNIPMDSVGEDWNQLEKKRMGIMGYLTQHSPWWNRIAKALFGGGFIFSVIMLYLYPTPVNFIMLGIYVFILIIGLMGFGSITAAQITRGGIPVKRAMVRIYNPNLRTEIAHRLTDENGRYYILIPNGEYYATVESPNADGTFSIIHTSEVFEITRALMNKDFIL